MNTMDELLAISSRLEHIESAAEWITRETVNTDSGISQTGTLISVLADELKERICELTKNIDIINEEFANWKNNIQ